MDGTLVISIVHLIEIKLEIYTHRYIFETLTYTLAEQCKQQTLYYIIIMFQQDIYLLNTYYALQFQGLVYGMLSIIALFTFNCKISTESSKASYLMYLVYFRGMWTDL